MKIGKNDFVTVQIRKLLGKQLFNLIKKVGTVVDLISFNNDLCTSSSIFLITESAAHAGALLHQNGVTMAHDFCDRCGRSRHAEFLLFDFL